MSPEGFNGTLDGEEAHVQEYMAWVDEHTTLNPDGPGGIHWKLGWCKEDERLPSCSVKAAKEVVSLDLDPSVDKILKDNIGGGTHLSPQEFHDQVQSVAASATGEKTAVLLDVRNVYEARIGAFKADEGVLTVNPLTRKFSDFRGFVDQNVHALKDKTIFAYCTGGVRCEKASRYLQYKGVADVRQLSGGICAYMDAFPEGGLFRGKNFVYDPRIALPYAGNTEASREVIGICAKCQAPHDDYRPQQRCVQCRMLVLVCSACLARSHAMKDEECRDEDTVPSAGVVCEHCTLRLEGTSVSL